jgi:hypothetical protein
MLPSLVHADDSKKDTITVLPWTDATLVIGSTEKRGAVQYAQPLPQSLALYVKATAPLDEDSRIAALGSENDFAPGFSGQIQFGYDQRTQYLRELNKNISDLAQARRPLVKIPDYAARGVLAEYCKYHNTGVCSDGVVFNHYCKRVTGESCEVSDATQMAAAFAAICQKRLTQGNATCGSGSLRDYAHFAVAYAELHECAQKKPEVLARDESCFAAIWGPEFLLSQRAAKKAFGAAAELQRTQQMAAAWKIVKVIAPAKADELKKISGSDDATLILEHPDAVLVVLNQVLRASALERRDLFLSGAMPGADRYTQAIFFDASLSYDRLEVYQDDLSADPKDEKNYDLEIGVNYTIYTSVPGLSINGRLGYERKRQSDAEKVKRCTEIPSSDTGTTGSLCDSDALFRSGDAPEPVNGEYFRLALNYQYLGNLSEDDVIPGLELRFGLEDTLSKDRYFEGRFALFGTPVKGTAAARAGIAFDVTYDPSLAAGGTDRRWTVTPIIFIGATVASLMQRP